MENIKIKDLIENGSNLAEKIKGLINNWDTRVDTSNNGISIVDEHLIWLGQVNKYFNDYFRDKKIKPHGFFNKVKNIFAPSSSEDLYSILGNEDLFVNFNDIYLNILKGIKILEEFSLKYGIKDNNNTKTVLLINKKDLSISKKDSGFAYCFQKRDGTNKRFDFLMKVLSKPSINAKYLMEYLDKKNIQTISTEKRNINKLLKKKLGIFDDVIINKDNTGYRINEEKYKIETIK